MGVQEGAKLLLSAVLVGWVMCRDLEVTGSADCSPLPMSDKPLLGRECIMLTVGKGKISGGWYPGLDSGQLGRGDRWHSGSLFYSDIFLQFCYLC